MNRQQDQDQKLKQKDLELKNMKEDRDTYYKQVDQLQKYLKESSAIQQQFENSRVASNQMQIMQDLQ